MNAEFWITIVAIVIGPLSAVAAAEYISRRRKLYEQKHAVFRALMKTRRTWLSPEHVEALNLIEIEFQGRKSVLEAYSKLFDFFEKGIAERKDEDENSYFSRRAKHHGELLSNLLFSMSKELGYKHDQFEIFRGGYSPEHFGQIEQDQEKVRKLFSGLYDGTKYLPIGVVDFRYPQDIPDAAKRAEEIIRDASSTEENP